MSRWLIFCPKGWTVGAGVLALAALGACRTTPDGGGGSDNGEEAVELADAEWSPAGEGGLPEFWPEDDLSSGPDWLPEWGEGPSAAATGIGAWMESGTEAINLARQLELPMLIWMSHPQAGAADGQLRREVLESEEFTPWLGERVIGLRIDWSREQTTMSPYYRAFRERYRTTGYPTVHLVLPDGTATARYTGYSSGQAGPWRTRLERDLERAEEAWERRKADLASQGYRDWHAREGGTFFARAIGREGSDAILIDAFRRRHRIPLNRFDAEGLSALLDLPDRTAGEPET